MSRQYVEQRLAQIAQERRTPVHRRGFKRILPASPKMPLDADVWTPPAVQLLAREELEELPEIGRNAKRPGVYFLFRDDVLVYIGSSTDVRGRVGCHDLYRHVQFNKATFLAVPWPWHMAVEALYIRRYAPKWNSTFIK